MEHIGSFIRKKRKQKNMSIRQLAKYAGVSAAYISQIENNYRRNPTAHVLRSIADGLNLSYEDFLSEFEYLSKANIQARQEDVDTYVIQRKHGNSNKEQKQKGPYNLYQLLMSEEQLYYKDHALDLSDKKKILTILQAFFE